jgi:hypothetical protein
MTTKTESEWSQEIISLTSYITSNFPEFSVYLDEVLERTNEHVNPENELHNAQEYYDSMEMLIKNYAISHILV